LLISDIGHDFVFWHTPSNRLLIFVVLPNKTSLCMTYIHWQHFVALLAVENRLFVPSDLAWSTHEGGKKFLAELPLCACNFDSSYTRCI